MAVQWHYRRPGPTTAAVLVWSSFGGIGGPCSWCVRWLWMHLFMEVSKTPSTAASDPGSRRYHCLLTEAALFLPRVSQFCRKDRPLSSQQFTAGVNIFPPESEWPAAGCTVIYDLEGARGQMSYLVFVLFRFLLRNLICVQECAQFTLCLVWHVLSRLLLHSTQCFLPQRGEASIIFGWCIMIMSRWIEIPSL